MIYNKPDRFDPSKSLRVKNWMGKVWVHSYLSEKSYLDEKGNNRLGNTRVELIMQPGEVITFPEGVAHYLATRMAEFSYGRTTANIAIAADRDERILKALPDLTGEVTTPVIEESTPEEPAEEAEETEEVEEVEVEEPKPKKKVTKKKKVEDEFVGLNEEE